MKKTFVLAHDTARKLCAEYLSNAPSGTRVTFSDPKRSLEENSMFHGLCEALSNSNVEFAGRRLKASEWKVLLISGHSVATQEGYSEIVTGLEGELVNIRESSAQMSKKRCASLIEYTLAFCAENGVEYKFEIDRMKDAGLIPKGE